MKRKTANSVIKGMIQDAVKTSVEKTVNGKIREVHTAVNLLHERIDDHIRNEERDITSIHSAISELKSSIEPAVSFFNTTNNIQRFFKWAGIPSFAALIVALYYIIKGI